MAPRGWHCLALYGSDGSFLIVTPKMHPAGDYFGSKHVELKGPVVQRLYNFGGTSGRFAVINAIGRYFPRYRSFIRDVQKMDLIMDPVPSGPYPHDLVRRQSDRFIRFTTPGHETGEGTRWLIAAGDQPVQGTRELIGPTKEPDLIGLNVRLSRADADLTSYILTNVK